PSPAESWLGALGAMFDTPEYSLPPGYLSATRRVETLALLASQHRLAPNDKRPTQTRPALDQAVSFRLSGSPLDTSKGHFKCGSTKFNSDSGQRGRNNQTHFTHVHDTVGNDTWRWPTQNRELSVRKVNDCFLREITNARNPSPLF